MQADRMTDTALDRFSELCPEGHAMLAEILRSEQDAKDLMAILSPVVLIGQGDYEQVWPKVKP